MLRVRFVLMTILLVGCPSAIPDAVEERFTLGDVPMVDIVFVVDDSNTTGPLQLNLGTAAANFLTPLNTRGVDWRIAIVTTDVEDPDRRGRIVGPVLSSAANSEADELQAALNVGIEGSQYEAGLSALWSAVSPPLSTHENADFRRDEARLAAIVISDEDDCSDEGAFGLEGPESCVSRPHELVHVEEYLERLLGVVPRRADLSVHAVVETGPTDGGIECGGQAPGTRYMELARATGGLVVPFCTPAAQAMSALGEDVAGRRLAFPLARTPDVTTIDIRVGEPLANEDVFTCGVAAAPGEMVPEDITRVDGWNYDSDANTVSLFGTFAPGFGQEVRVCYEIGT